MLKEPKPSFPLRFFRDGCWSIRLWRRPMDLAPNLLFGVSGGKVPDELRVIVK